MTKKEQNHAPLIVAVDDGFADIKVAWFDKDGKIQTSITPATAQLGWHFTGIGSNNFTNAYTTEDQKFTVDGSVPSPVTTRFSEYFCSPLNRVLIHHALKRAGFVNQEIALTTGVTPESYQNNLDRIAQQKADSLAKQVFFQQGLEQVVLNNIVSSNIASQTISAYINLLINDAGERNQDLDGKSVAVVDIGGRTTDYIAVQDIDGEMALISDITYSKEIGLLNVYKAIRQSLLKKYDIDFKVRDDLLEISNTGEMRHFGEIIDVSDIVAEAKEAVAREIVEELNYRIKAYPRLQQIIFVGGGAEALATELESAQSKLGSVRGFVHEDARYANAKGMLKYATFVLNYQS